MQLKRPLCLFGLLFAAVLFLLQCLPKGENAVEKDLSALERKKVLAAGCLTQKEAKNGHLILYLKQVEINLDYQNQSNTFQSDTNQSEINQKQSNQNHTIDIDGVICYLQEGSLEALPPLGSEVMLQGQLMLFEQAENEGQFDRKQYYTLLGYSCSLVSASILKTGDDYDWLAEQLFLFRTGINHFYEAWLSEKNAGILSAMLLGDKTGMDTEIKDLYRQSGIAHVLAISGLHISLLGMCFYKLLRKCFVPPWICSLCGIVVIYLYGKMTGGGASSFRAGVMFAMFLMADLLERSYDLLTAMSLSAILLLLRQPMYIGYAGFLLSFLAVMGLALVQPVLEDMVDALGFQNKIYRKPLSSLLAGISIQSMTFPVLLWFYYEFPMYSFLLNLIVIPLMSIVLVSGILAGILRFPVLLLPVELILELYESLCRFFEGADGHTIITGRPQSWQAMLYYAGLLLWLGIYHARKKKKNMKYKKIRSTLAIAVPLLCMFLLAALARAGRRADCVDMLSIGQGDCIALRDETGTCILVDGGSSDIKEAGKYRLLPYLKYNGISQIEVAFVSHAHTDHYSALLELLKESPQNGIRVRYLGVSTLAQKNAAYEELFQAALQAGCQIIYVPQGEQLKCGKIRLQCLYPGAGGQVTDENDASLVLLAEIEQRRQRPFSILLTGDSTSLCDEPVIEEMTKRGISDISCLKVQHHGAKTSNSQLFLNAVSAQTALISCGKDNSYGHPHQEVLTRLKEAKTVYFITSRQGQIRIRLFDGSAKVSTYVN